MKKKFTISIIAVIVALIIVGALLFNNNVSVAPNPANQQQNKNGQELINSEVTKGKTCEDSDGLDYYTKGKLSICDFETYEEPGATSPVGCALHEDFCPSDFDDPTGKELYEYYCEGNELKFKKYTCPNRCQDGACIE